MAFRISRKRKALPENVDQDGVDAVAENKPASRLIIGNALKHGGAFMLRHLVELRLVKGRDSQKSTRQILKDKPLSHTLASIAVARIATRSVPGAAIVGTGLLVKNIYERGMVRRAQRLLDDTKSADSTDE